MVGTAVDGQLTTLPATPRRRVWFAVATPADDAAVRRLLRDTPTRGAISLSFEREPDYFLGANLAEADDRTIVAFEDGQLICLGRCTTRPCWVNGTIQPVAYLAELRLAANARGRLDVLRGGYRFFQRLRPPSTAAFTFTSIAADNHRARRLLERGVRGLPRYEFLANYVTLLVPTTAGRGAARTLETARAADIAALLDAHSARDHLRAAWSEEHIAACAAHGLRAEDFGVIRRQGKIVACAGLWDQRAFRQTVIRGYAGSLALGRGVINTFGRALGLPRLPAPGTVLAHAFLSPLAVADQDVGLLLELIAASCRRAAERGLEFVTLGFSAEDVGVAAIRRRFRCRSYASRLYRVRWPDQPAAALDARPFRPEVAFL